MNDNKAYSKPRKKINLQKSYDLLNRQIPTSGYNDTFEEEKYVIGVAIQNDDARKDLLSILRKPSMFSSKKNRIVWASLVEMHSLGTPIEESTLIRNLKNNNKEVITLEEYKHYTERGIPSTAKTHAEFIYTNFCVRSVKIQAKKLYNSETATIDDVTYFLGNQIELVEKLSKLLPNKDRNISGVIDKSLELISNPESVIPFPIKTLNEATGGLTRGHTTILGGRTGHGKTTTLANLVDGWLKQGYTVRWYSREQKAEEMMQTCILLNAGIDNLKVRKKQLNDEDNRKIREAVLRMQEPYKNLVIKDDIDNMKDTISDIVSCTNKPDIVIDDFIQLIDTEGFEQNKRGGIESILKKYHWLQKRYNFATVMASQLSRAVETRQFDNEPRLSDLAEASFIEQLSETVILLWWEYKFLLDSSDLREDEIKYIFGKARFGKNGYIILRMSKGGVLNDV